MTKTVLITGTSSGIGKATAQVLSAKGWNVIATMRDPGGVAGANANVLTAQLDVADLKTIEKSIAAGIAHFGRIDAVVNNAGYGQNGLFEGLTREQVLDQFKVNVFGVMDVIRSLLPHFRQNGGGTIINISSGAGLYTLPMTSIYCASKFALEGFTEAISYELASQNIVVKSVIPHGGVTDTQFSAKAAAGLSSERALASYDEFVQATKRSFENMIAARAQSAEAVANVIYEAMTDGRTQLRYLVGDDARGFVRARRELSEESYEQYMRAFFQ
jgi:NAD(P)-dependent dehydrogenase (short-subunit alcohol dehydrogenase family)